MMNKTERIVAEATAALHKQVVELERNTNLLTEQNLKLEIQLAVMDAKLKWYEERFRLSQHKKFGASSEKSSIICPRRIRSARAAMARCMR